MADKIVHVVQHLQPGGIETIVLELIRTTKDADIHIVSLEGQKDEVLESWDRLVPFADNLHFMEKKPGWRFSTINKLNKWFRAEKPAAIHTHHIGPLIYGGLACRSAKIPKLLHTEHDAWHLNNKKRRRLQGVILGLTNPYIISDSKAVDKALEKYFPKIRRELIYNGIDLEKFQPGDMLSARQKLNLPERVTLVGCAARLEEVKGQDVLIDALAKLPENIHCAFAGTGSLHSDYLEQASALGISDRVHFLGNQDDMTTFYQAIEIFCLPSRNEGLPLSPLEAQACNKPVISTDVGGSSEAVCPNTGVLVPSESDELMSQGILALVNGKTGVPRDFVKGKFNLIDMAESYKLLATQLGAADED